VSLRERIETDLKNAMKARERARLQALRMLKSDLENRRIEQGRALTDDEVVAGVRGMVKKRRESVEAYRQGGRDELAERETAEIELLSSYLPAELSDAALTELVAEARADLPEGQQDQFGPLMGVVMRRVAGRADGQRVRRAVSDLLEG